MALAGLRGTGDWGTDERPKNFRETILWLQPNGQTPLTALMARMKTQSVDDPEFSWWEEKLQTIRVQATADMLATSTVLTVAGGVLGGYNLKKGDVLIVEKADSVTYDNEIVVVSTVTSDTSVTIVRGAAGSTAAGFLSGTYLTRIGSVYPEGASAAAATTRNPTKLSNFAQIFKDSYELTKTAAKTRARTGDPKKNDKKRKMFDHSVALEWAFLLGKKYETTGSNGKPERYTGGLRSYLSSNVTVFATTPTITTFLDAISPVFNYSASDAGNERICLVGNSALNSLNKLIANNSNVQIRYAGTVNEYRMKLHVFETPQGVFYLKTHPLLSNHALFTKSMFIIDPTNIIYRPVRDTDFEDDIQNKGDDYHKGQWLTEAGIEVHHQETMGYIGNFVV